MISIGFLSNHLGITLPPSPVSDSVQPDQQPLKTPGAEPEHFPAIIRRGLPTDITVGNLRLRVGALITRMETDDRRIIHAALTNILPDQNPEPDKDGKFSYQAFHVDNNNNKIMLQVSGESDRRKNLSSLTASLINVASSVHPNNEQRMLSFANFSVNSISGGHQALQNKPIRSRSFILNQAITAVQGSSGIGPIHLKKLHEIACREDCIILFRPVDPHNKPLIDDNYPTKGLEIKGKSSNWGPQYGFICLDQHLSKLQSQPEKALEASTKAQASCAEINGPQAIPLRLTHQRLLYLHRAGLLHMMPADEGFILDTHAPDGSHQRFSAVAASENEGYLIQQGGVSIQVLAPRLVITDSYHVQKPYVADFDLLALMPNMKTFSGQDQRKDVLMGAKGSLNFSQSEQDLLASSQSLRASHHSERMSSRSMLINRVTEREQRIADAINQELRPNFNSTKLSGYEDAWKLVHHGSDEGNAVTEPEANLPATVICPVQYGLAPVQVLHNEHALARLISVASTHGYRLAGNPQWPSDLKKDTVFSKRLEMWRSRDRRDSLF